MCATEKNECKGGGGNGKNKNDNLSDIESRQIAKAILCLT